MSQRRTVRFIVATAVAVGASFVAGGVAHAGDGPYGSTTTDPPPPPAQATCTLTIEGGDPGDTGAATVTDVPQGELVRILFGGVEGGRAEAPDPSPGGRATVTVLFTVPELASGSVLVSAVGSTFTAECDAEFGLTGVLGNVVDRPGSGGSGSLPRTGIYVGLLVAIGLALLVVGRSLLEAGRRRRRRAWAAENQVRHLTRSPDR